MKCNKCGYENTNGSSFCQNCGNQMNSQPMNNQPMNNQPMNSQPMMNNQPMNSQPMNNQPMNNQNNNGSKKKFPIGIIIGIVAGIIVLGVAAITLINVLSTIRPKYDENKKPIYITEPEYSDFMVDPDAYLGKFVTLKGMVASAPFRLKNGNNVFYMYTDVKNYDGEVYVEVDKSVVINDGDYVIVDGYDIGSSLRYKEYKSYSVNPSVISTSVKKDTYVNVMKPAIKTITPNEKMTDQGCTITIQKVEYAEEETRVYVKISNSSENEISTMLSKAAILKDSKQYNYIYKDMKEELEDLPSQVKGGATVEGVIIFPAIEGDFEIRLYPYSNDWKITLKEFAFFIADK